MPAFVWVALAVFLVLFLAGGIWVAVNAARAWRRGWPVVRRLSEAASELPPKIAVIESQVAVLEPRLTDLQRSTASLAAAIRHAKLLLEVLLEAKHTIDVARIVLRFR